MEAGNIFRKIPGQKGDHAQLGKFRRLDAEGADSQPAARTVAQDPDSRNQHHHQQEKTEEKPRLGPPNKQLRIRLGGEEHQKNAHSRKQKLSLGVIQAVPVRVMGVGGAGAVYHDHPDRQQ